MLKFSKKFMEQVEARKQKGYELKSAKVNFVVYWKKPDTEQEIQIILPEVGFDRLT